MNQKGEHLKNLCELNILEINTKSYSLCVLHMIVKARTRHRFMEDACIREGISLMNTCRVNPSVI